jgi:hypothetical protein
MKISSSTELCNLALLRVNQNTISSIEEDNSIQAQLCRYTYDQSRQSLLYQYPWSFATQEKSLAQIPPENPLINASINYTYAYTLPDAFLRLISLYDASNRELIATTDYKPAYEIQNTRVLSDINGIKMKYTFDLETVTQMSPLFIDSMVCDLAIRITKVFNDSSTYLQQLQQDFNLTFEKAKIEDARQKQLPPIKSYPLLQESYLF